MTAESNNPPGMGGATPGPYDEMGRVLAGLPRPRSIRMGWQGKMSVAIFAVALSLSLGMFLWFGRRVEKDLPRPEQRQVAPAREFVLPAGMVVVGLIFLWRIGGQERRLLINGELGHARVVKRWAGRNGPYVQYEFATPTGERISRNAADKSRQLSVGMTVPVFYDSLAPKRQVPLCSSIYKFILPQEIKPLGAR